MRELGIKYAFTFDEDFKQGLQPILSPKNAKKQFVAYQRVSCCSRLLLNDPEKVEESNIMPRDVHDRTFKAKLKGVKAEAPHVENGKPDS